MDTGSRSTPPFSLNLTIDEAIDRLGYGAFQKRVLVAAGCCSASDAMEILLLSFLAFSVQIEWCLSVQERNYLIAVVFAGAFFGTLMLGRLGDVLGRKPTFVITAAIVAIFGLLTCFSQNFIQLATARFFVGVGIGGGTVPFDTYSEFLPSESRGRNLVLPSYFWTAGTVMVAVIAHATLGQDYSRWRVLCFWCSVPCIFATVVSAMVVPESPRWLLSHKGDERKALKIIKQAAQQNGIDPDRLFPPGTTLIRSLPSPDDHGGIWELLSPQWFWTSIALWAVWACYALMYYGTVLVVSLLFSSASAHSQSGNSEDGKQSFRVDYGAIFASTLAEVAGATFVLFTIDNFGRRTMHTLSFLLGGILVLTLCLFAGNYSQESTNLRSLLIAIAFLARMFIFSGSIITWIWTAEILSTELRSTGHSVANAAARIGGFLAPYLVSSTTPFTVIGLVMIGISLCIVTTSRYLPETYGVQMGKAVPEESNKRGYQHLSATDDHALEALDHNFTDQLY